MTQTKLLATSILASMALLGAAAATQAASPTEQTGQVAVDQRTGGATAQTAKTRASPGLVAKGGSDDQGTGGVEGDDRDDRNGAEDNDRDEHNDAENDEREDHNNAEDDDREDRGQTGENEGEHED